MNCKRVLAALALVLLTAGAACADLDAYISSLSISANADLGGFRTQVGAHFGASGSQLDLVFRSVDRPADAALCFWLGRQSGQSIDIVLREYQAHRGQGWGVMAQNLGIKPGSAAFHALKRGDLGWQPAASGGKGNGKGNGKGKGHK